MTNVDKNIIEKALLSGKIISVYWNIKEAVYKTEYAFINGKLLLVFENKDGSMFRSPVERISFSSIIEVCLFLEKPINQMAEIEIETNEKSLIFQELSKKELESI